MAFNTGNPTGSTSPKDLSDNAQNLDLLLLGDDPSYRDRRGVGRKSWKGMEREYAADKVHRDSEFEGDQAERVAQFTALLDASGYEPPVPYVLGLNLVRTTQTVTYLGNEYRVKNQFLPLLTTNWAVDESKLKLIGDASLRQELASSVDASKGTGQLGNSIITLGTVADMVAMGGWRMGQRVRTMGRSAIGDGGSNEYVIVPAGTGIEDGGQFINVAGAQARGLFPGGKISSKQFNANGNAVTDSQEVPIQAALNTIITDSTDRAWGASVTLKLGAYLSKGLQLLGDRLFKGSGGPNATKLIASPGTSADSAMVRISAAFSRVENLGINIPIEVYNPSTGVGIPVDGFKIDSENAFGNVLRDFRVNGGRYGVDVAFGRETSIKDGFIIGSNIGVRIKAWDTVLNNTLVQDCVQYCVHVDGHGLESIQAHLVRAPILIRFSSNGAPVHVTDLFLDTPGSIGAVFNDQRGARLVSTYILKIGNNANSNAVGMKFEGDSSENALIGGSTINTGSNYAGVFQLGSDCINNIFAFWRTLSKTVAFDDHASMWRQTIVGCMGHMARYNNIPRKNRGHAKNVAAGATAQIILTLDYAYPAITFNTLLFYGKWVSRNSDGQAAFGNLYVPIQYGDFGCAISVSKISGHANNSWVIDSAILGGTQMIVTVRNTGTFTSSISIDIERSLDATGVTF